MFELKGLMEDINKYLKNEKEKIDSILNKITHHGSEHGVIINDRNKDTDKYIGKIKYEYTTSCVYSEDLQQYNVVLKLATVIITLEINDTYLSYDSLRISDYSEDTIEALIVDISDILAELIIEVYDDQNLVSLANELIEKVDNYTYDNEAFKELKQYMV